MIYLADGIIRRDGHPADWVDDFVRGVRGLMGCHGPFAGRHSTGPPLMRLSLLGVLRGVRVELRFAGLGAEVVRLTVELAAARRLRRVNLHPTDNVSFHMFLSELRFYNDDASLRPGLHLSLHP
jgi:hypothetical protein